MIRLFSILSILFFVILMLPTHTRADEDLPQGTGEILNVTYEDVNPDNGLSYDLKRLKEKFNLWFYSWSSTSKADYYLLLADRRLAELKYIIDNKQMAFFEKGTQRYFSTTGQLAEFIDSSGLNDKKDGVKLLFASHIPVLEKLRDRFDPSTAEWRFVQDDINYVLIQTKQLE